MKRDIRIGLVLILTILSVSACRKSKVQTDKSEIATPSQHDTSNVVIDEFQEIPYYPSQKTTPYEVVEQMPQFPGGDKKLLHFIDKNIKYPVIALENNIQGTVIIRFVVTKKGEVEKYEVLRSLDPACDREALRIVAALPNWIPGKQNGMNVNVYYTLPIRFKLE